MVHGVDLAWRELGEGPPLVMLHGIRDYHRTFRRVAPLLADEFRVLLLDLAGHGFSDRPGDAAYTLGYHANLVAGWMRAIGVPKAHIVGHSYGGGVAQWMLLEHRDRFDRLALVAPGGLGPEVTLLLRMAALPWLGARVAPMVQRYALSHALRFGARFIGDMEHDERRLFVTLNRRPGTDHAFHRTLDGVVGMFGQHAQTLNRLGEVPRLPPIAMFWGEADLVIPVDHGRNMYERTFGTEITTYPGVGHFPHLDVPLRFVADLTRFLTTPYVQPARLRKLNADLSPREDATG